MEHLLAATVAGVLDLFPRLAERMGQAAGLTSGGEQQMLAIADRVHVIEHGRVALDGPTAKLATDSRLRAAYLGM